MSNSILRVGNLIDFSRFLKGEEISDSPGDSAIIYDKETNTFLVKEENILPYKKAPTLTLSRFIEDMKLLEVQNNHFIPIIDMSSSKVVFTKEDFDLYRRKMSGLEEYGTGDYVFADNLSFDGIDSILEQIDSNKKEIEEKIKPTLEEVKKVLSSIGLTTTIGMNSGGDVELIEAGSTSRLTNIPTTNNSKWDFDFTVRTDPDKIWLVKNALESKLDAKGHITRTSNYKVRLVDVVIPELENPIDLDFSLVPQKEEYLSTEQALSKRLDNMKKQDNQKYRMVLANIIYAKTLLKKAGAYKPSRGILEGDRSYGGLGGVGIENWILQYGGSFELAARDFLKHAEGKSFLDFEKEYAIMDFGQDHVSHAKGEFPYHNFIMRNMRENGYYAMREALRDFINQLDYKNQSAEEKNMLL